MQQKETYCNNNTFFLYFNVFQQEEESDTDSPGKEVIPGKTDNPHANKDCPATTSVPPLKRPRCPLNDLLGATFASAKDSAAIAHSAHDVAAAEIRGFREEPPLPLTEDPLCWWREHQQEYPQLSKVAKSLLCIPGTSVAAEQVFSTAGDIVTAQRRVLKAEHVDKLVFLHKNLHLSINVQTLGI